VAEVILIYGRLILHKIKMKDIIDSSEILKLTIGAVRNVYLFM